MKTRAQAAKELWLEWKSSTQHWWITRSAGDSKDQTSMWLAAVGIPATLLGLILCPRLTVLACAGVYVWSKIEERR